MNNIRQYILESYNDELRGEWWIDDGRASFADGDTGDYNHEGVAFQDLASEIATGFGLDHDGDWEDNTLESKIKESLIESGTHTSKEVEHNFKNLVIKNIKAHNTHEAEELYKAVFGGGEASWFVMKHRGWKRVASNWVETYSLNPNDLKSITKGLADAYDDDLQDDTLISIEVREHRHLYEKVPYSLLEKHNINALKDYRSSY